MLDYSINTCSIYNGQFFLIYRKKKKAFSNLKNVLMLNSITLEEMQDSSQILYMPKQNYVLYKNAKLTYVLMVYTQQILCSMPLILRGRNEISTGSMKGILFIFYTLIRYRQHAFKRCILDARKFTCECTLNESIQRWIIMQLFV